MELMEEYQPYNIAEKILDAIQKERNNLTKLNVMVLGKTGVGKSTLINNVFSESLAETGVGKPITDRIRKYEKDGFPLTIYDSPGLELAGENSIKELLKEVTDVIKQGIKRPEDAIHCIWYCVSTPSHRFEEAEREFINKFLAETSRFEIPVIIILTQSYSKRDAQELKAEIEKENLNVVQIVPVLASSFMIDEEYTVKAYGMDSLIDVMENVVPEAVKKTLVAVQKANIKLKVNKAHAAVIASAVGAAATGAVPFPMSDAFLLVPEQIAMIAGITNIFGLSVEKATISTVVSSTIGTAGTTVLGKTIFSSILKCIPGAGTVAGGVISGAIAAALTASLGEAYIAIMVMVAKGEVKMNELGGEKGKKLIADIFKSRLSLKRDKEGKVVRKEDEIENNIDI